MSEKKEVLETDLMKKLKGEDKIKYLLKEINCLHFFPSTNIILNPSVNTGNFHLHMYQIVARAVILYCKNSEIFSEERDADIEKTIIIPAISFAVTGIANCDALTAYAYYRWFTTADLSNSEELPVFMRFIEENREGVEIQMHHHAFAVGLNLDSENYKSDIVALKNKDIYTPIDFWLKTADKEEIIRTTLQKFPKITSLDLSLPIATKSLTYLKKLQIELPLRFEAASKRFKRIFQQILNETLIFSNENCQPLSKDSYVHLSSLTLIRPSIIVDLKAAHLYMREIYQERDNATGHRLTILATIQYFWEYLIRNISVKENQEIYLADSLPIVQEMVTKLLSLKKQAALETKKTQTEIVTKEATNTLKQYASGGILMYFRQCCRKRRSPQDNNNKYKKDDSMHKLNGKTA